MALGKRSLTLVAALAVTSFVVAQPPGGGRGFGRGGGMGGIGGSSGGDQVRLLELADVQKELKFSDDDKAALPLLKEEFQESDQKYRESLREFFQPGERPDMAAMMEKTMERSKVIDKQLGEVLGDRVKRFREVRRQLVGINNALSGDFEVREAIALTEDQQTQIREKVGEAMREMFGGFGQRGKRGERDEKGEKGEKGEGQKRPGGNFAEIGKKMEETQKKVYDEVLTEAQKAKWKELQGAPISFKLPEDFNRGGFGGGDRKGRGKGRKQGGDNPPPAL